MQRQKATVQDGWEALERSEWAAALDLFRSITEDSDDPRAYEGLAWAAWWSNDHPAVFSARMRTFELFRERDDPVSASRAAIWLGSDHHELRGEHAVANGWYQRARRLLRDLPTCAEHGWLAFHEGAYALELGDDTVTARIRAAEVATTAAELDHRDLEFLSLALEGLALVTEGNVDSGMSRLDEVGVAATTGELHDRIATTWSLCFLIYACERVRDFERAAEWCVRSQEISTRFVFEFGMGLCRAHYGSVLVMHGQWDAAEKEFAAAGTALAHSRPRAGVEASVRVAELRRRQGRIDEAWALFTEALPHALAVAGLAQIALDRGEPAGALEMLEDLLARTPLVSVTQRADALALLTRARAIAGDTDAARDAADRLSVIAGSVGTRPLLGMAALAQAAAAEAVSDLTATRRHLAAAINLFDRCGLSFEAATARRELGRIRNGDTVFATLPRPSQADARPAIQKASPLTILSPREIEVITLLVEGLSDQGLAERLFISSHTAHRHVSNILTKLNLPNRAAAAALAARHGLGRVGA